VPVLAFEADEPADDTVLAKLEAMIG